MIAIVVDYQHDFIDGELRVPGAYEIMLPIEKICMDADFVIATRDWHSPTHSSFKGNGGIWPAHCIAGSWGATIIPRIERFASVVISKGMDDKKDGYSAVENPHFIPLLRNASVYDADEIVVCGLALDRCVGSTVLDIAEFGFENIIVPSGATRGLDKELVAKTLESFKEYGVHYV
jgi:nicotinamidase/pyrazinamidase